MNNLVLSLMTMLPGKNPAALLTIAESKIITGTVNLLNDAVGVLIGVASAAAIVAEIILGIMKMSADENDAPRYKKRMIGVVIVFAIILCASGIIAVVTSYYA